MDTSYLHDAFKSLEILDEEIYDISEDDAFDKAESELAKDPKDVIDIIDMDFEDETDMPEEVEEETHIGDVIFDCPVCHSKIYKHPDEVTVDENEEYANVGEECPYCFTSDGFKIIGQVAPYQEEEIEVDIEDKKEIEDSDDDSESDSEDVNESLKKLKSDKKKITESKKSRKIKESKEVDLTEYQKWVDYDMRKYHKISKNTMSKIKKAGLSVVKDQYGEYEVIADRPDNDSESFKESKLTEKNWSYTIKSGAKLRKAIEDEDYEAIKEALIDCYSELFNAGIIDEDDYDTYVSEVEFLDAEDEDTLDDFDYELSDFYDLCDNLNVWVALDESLKKSKKVREGFEKVELETDDQKITVKSEPRMGSEEAPAIVPVSDEIKDEISMDTKEEDSEVESDDEESIDYDIDEFDEENFDELGESYLKNVYGNVKSFKTVNLGQLKNQLIIEGLITFDSGKQKKTRFVFEAKNATKKGKLSFIGENLQLSRGKKSFVLRGQYNKGKFMSESLNYNYKTKDGSGKSTKVYGTVKVKK